MVEKLQAAYPDAAKQKAKVRPPSELRSTACMRRCSHLLASALRRTGGDCRCTGPRVNRRASLIRGRGSCILLGKPIMGNCKPVFLLMRNI